MKKIVSILIVLLILLQFNIVQATDENSEKATVEIGYYIQGVVSPDTKTITSSIYLGEVKNIGEAKVVGYTAKLIYDSELVENVTVTGQNGWTTTYTNGAIVANCDNIEANKEIAKIEFTLKTGIESGDILHIKLSDFQISNDANLKQTIGELTKTVMFKEEEKIPDNKDDKLGSTNNTTDNTTNSTVAKVNNAKSGIGTNNTSTTDKKGTSTNKTNTTTSKLPKAGQGNVLFIIITIITIIGIVCVVKEKNIKIK